VILKTTKSTRLKDLVLLAGATFVNNLCLFLASLLVANYLSLAEYGAVRTITNYIFIVSMLGTLTFHDALPARLLHVDKKEYSKIIINTIIFIVVWLTFYISIGFFTLWKVNNISDSSVYHGLLVLIPFLALPVVEIILQSTFQVIGPVIINSRYLLISGFVNLLCLIVTTYFLGFKGWLIGRLLTWIFMNIVVVTFLVKYVPSPVFSKFDYTPILKMLKFAKFQMLSLILSLFIMSIDVLYIEYALGVSEVALYAIGLLFVNASMSFCNVLKRVYFVKLKNPHTEYLAEFVIASLSSGVLLSILVYCFVPFFIEYFYGTKFEGYESIFKIQCFIIPFSFVFHSISAINISQNNSKRSLLISAWGALLVCVLLPTLVSVYGSNGAALAILLVYIITCIYGLKMIFADLALSFNILMTKIRNMVS